MKESKNIPEIRFEGFEGEWEELTLGDMGQITMGQSPSSVNYTTDSKYHILVQGNSDMKNGKVTPRVWTKQVTKTADSGDLIISVRAPVGDVGKTSYNVVIGRGVAAIKANEFVFQSLIKKKEFGYWDQFSTGSTFESINSNVLKKAIISTTSQKEQSQIGTFFQNLDQQITLEQQKHDKLVTLKKAMLEKMFPKEGASVPEIRFEGFEGEWEKKLIRELCSISTGKSNTQDQDADGLYPFFIRSEVPGRSNKYLFDCEAVLTIGDGNIGKVFHYVNGKFDLHQRVYKMDNFVGIFGRYFYYYFSTKFYKRAMKMTAKATVDSVRLDMISEMEIKMPVSLNEQKHIAKYFQNLDNLISLQQQKIDKLKNIKKACLDKMFV